MRGICEDAAPVGSERFDAGIGRYAGSGESCDEQRRTSVPVPPSPPPIPVRRWVPHRKAELIAAVRGGSLSLDAACKRYDLTVEEFLAWQHGIDLFGMAGLRVYKPRTGRTLRKKSAAGKSSRPHRRAAPKGAEPDDGGPEV